MGGGTRDGSRPDMDALVGSMFPVDDRLGPAVTVQSYDKLLTVLQSNSMGYYHWMVECLPKLAAAMPLLRAQPDIKVLVPCREFAEKTAVMLGLAPSRLVRNSPGSVFHCKELYFASFIPNRIRHQALQVDPRRVSNRDLHRPHRVTPRTGKPSSDLFHIVALQITGRWSPVLSVKTVSVRTITAGG